MSMNVPNISLANECSAAPNPLRYAERKANEFL